MSVEIKNKVAASGLITLDLETFVPQPGEIAAFDLQPFLFQGLILREKDFRQALKTQDWSEFEGKHLAVYCSGDAIIPVWAYMLVAANASPFAKDFYFGSPEELKKVRTVSNIQALDPSPYIGQKLVIKGCGDEGLGAEAYMAITAKLRPHVFSMMYGEPCSTVPIYKKPRVAPSKV